MAAAGSHSSIEAWTPIIGWANRSPRDDGEEEGMENWKTLLDQIGKAKDAIDPAKVAGEAVYDRNWAMYDKAEADAKGRLKHKLSDISRANGRIDSAKALLDQARQ